MKFAAVVAVATLLSGAAPASRVTDRDFRELMQAAAEAASHDVEAQTRTICVKRDLDPPLSYSRGAIQILQDAARSSPWMHNDDVDRSLAAALEPNALVARQTKMPSLQSHYVVLASGVSPPPQCVVHHVPPPPGWPRYESAVILTFTRPAFANGNAYINEYEECPGLCGTTFLRVFRKQRGKWIQVRKTILSVS